MACIKGDCGQQISHPHPSKRIQEIWAGVPKKGILEIVHIKRYMIIKRRGAVVGLKKVRVKVSFEAYSHEVS